jgi:hypothetical protein
MNLVDKPKAPEKAAAGAAPRCERIIVPADLREDWPGQAGRSQVRPCTADRVAVKGKESRYTSPFGWDAN